MNNKKLLTLLCALGIVVFATMLLIRTYDPSENFKIAEAEEQAKIAEIQALLGEAYTHFQNNELNSAEKRLHLLLRNAPNNISALQLLGNVYFLQKKYTEAEKTFRALIRIDPHRSINYNNLGQTLVMQGKFIDSVQEFKSAIKLAPQLAMPRLNLAQVYIKINHKKGALKELEKAIELAQETNSININLQAFQALKDEPEFKAILEKSVKQEVKK